MLLLPVRLSLHCVLMTLLCPQSCLPYLKLWHRILHLGQCLPDDTLIFAIKSDLRITSVFMIDGTIANYLHKVEHVSIEDFNCQMIPYKSCITRIEIVICKFVVHWYRIVEDIPHIGSLKVRPVASLTLKPQVSVV